MIPWLTVATYLAVALYGLRRAWIWSSLQKIRNGWSRTHWPKCTSNPDGHGYCRSDACALLPVVMVLGALFWPLLIVVIPAWKFTHPKL